jgi:hypothetical protein
VELSQSETVVGDTVADSAGTSSAVAGRTHVTNGARVWVVGVSPRVHAGLSIRATSNRIPTIAVILPSHRSWPTYRLIVAASSS